MNLARCANSSLLVNRVLEPAFATAMQRELCAGPALQLTPKETADFELIATGGYSPLDGFMRRLDYESVVDNMRLTDGSAWPLPVTLSVGREELPAVREGQSVALANNGQILGALHVEAVYAYDKQREAGSVFGTEDPKHPGVLALYQQKEFLVGGRVTMIQRPVHAEFALYRLDPAETRRIFRQRGWQTVVGFQTRNPVHRAHEYLQKCALEIYDGLFLQPLVGPTKDDDIPAEVRIRCYESLLESYYPKDRVLLAVYPAAMRYAGPREAVFHALVRRNYGCTHFIVGRDHAGVGNYYDTYAAHKIFSNFGAHELGITPVFFEHSFYCRACGTVASRKTCPHGEADHLVFSGTMVRGRLQRGEPLPPEFTRPEVARILMEAASQAAPEEKGKSAGN